MNPDPLWRRFVALAVLSALIPGFGLAGLMTGAWLIGAPPGLWYLAAVQTHSVALLMGWGGAMILGVALYFLPRLRGVKLARAQWAPVWFWLLALGLALRIGGQLLLATLNLIEPGRSVAWLNGGVVTGVALQAIGVGGLLGLLLITFRAGRPLKANEGFRQIAPLLGVAAFALSLAQLAWGAGVIQGLRSAPSLAVLPMEAQWTAADWMVFGFVPAVSVAMSSRLFPLTFRTKLPSPRGLLATAGLLSGGVLLTGVEGSRLVFSWPLPSLAGWAGLCDAAGLIVGAFSVRIFHARKKIPGAMRTSWLREDPAAAGVLTAYIWAVVAALFLIVLALEQAGVRILAQWAQANLARHAVGLGFMTLLIVSVGWKMLPGFCRGRPRGRGWLWSTVWLGNLAVVLRLLPSVLPPGPAPGRSWSEILHPLAGLAGLATILAFAGALRLSFRTEKPVSP